MKSRKTKLDHLLEQWATMAYDGQKGKVPLVLDLVN